jgi:hypothetical protein
MSTYTLDTKQKFFILNGEKHYFSAIDKISVFHEIDRIKFVFYRENKQQNTFAVKDIPSALAQDLINLCHVQVEFSGYSFVVGEIK